MIRCLKQKRKSHSSQKFNCHIELISNLRYCHLAGARGHCFEYYLDDSTISRCFFFFFSSFSNLYQVGCLEAILHASDLPFPQSPHLTSVGVYDIVLCICVLVAAQTYLLFHMNRFHWFYCWKDVRFATIHFHDEQFRSSTLMSYLRFQLPPQPEI